MLAGGIAVTALVTVPDLAGTARAGIQGTGSPAPAGAGHFFLYGVADDATHASHVQTLGTSAGRTAVKSAATAVTTDLSATPVASPDGTYLSLSTVTMADGGAQVTVTIVSKATGTVARTASFAIPDVPADTGILVTPAFSPDSSVVTIVLAITVKTNRRMVRKRDPRNGGVFELEAGTLRSRHALAYLDMKTGALTGPLHLNDAGTLALSTAVATDKELFLWTTRDPQDLHLVKGYGGGAPLPGISAYPFGSAKARLTTVSAAPWPSSEPAVALPSGDAARLVNARTIQVVSARNGDLSQHALAPLGKVGAKPSPATMAVRPDGTVFLTKPGVGRAAIADPARGFAVTRDIQFPAPYRPSGGPLSKAVLSPDGERLYVLGGSMTGGLSVYDVAKGKLTASYSHGAHYTGLYLLSSGILLAVSAANPRLSYFSADLAPLGTADTGISVAEVY